MWEQAFKNVTDMLGFAVRHVQRPSFWMYTSRGVYELVIQGEDSEMCRLLFLQQGKFR